MNTCECVCGTGRKHRPRFLLRTFSVEEVERLGLNRETPDLCLASYAVGRFIAQLSRRAKLGYLHLYCNDVGFNSASNLIRKASGQRDEKGQVIYNVEIELLAFYPVRLTADFRSAMPSIRRENPVMNRFAPTRLLMAHPESDGQ